MIQLLEKIKILNKFHKKINQISDENFNMFKICGVNHYENTHSAILCELLASDSSHNFKHKFLEALINTLKKDNILPDEYEFSFTNLKVIPEFYISSLGRIDIFIRNDKQCIIIENKIYAEDQFEQLKRYEEYAKKNYGENYKIIYLTLWGDEASEQSSQNVNYYQVSYAINIINWIESCIAISARSPIIRETLIQYVNHLKYLTNNTTILKMNIEVIELLAQEENIEATFSISENINNVKNHLINKVLIPQLKKICNDLHLELQIEEVDRVNIAYSGFTITNPKWKYFDILFEFASKGLKDLNMGLVYKNTEFRNEEVFNFLTTKFKSKHDNWVYSEFPKHSCWGKEAMISIANGEMANIFKTEIEYIIGVTKDLEM